jgi:hypothetical protein
MTTLARRGLLAAFTTPLLAAFTTPLLAACTTLLLAGCAGLAGPPTLTLTQADADRLLRGRFPIERRLLEVVDASMRAPALRLVPETNRLAAVVEVQAHDRLLGGSWQGLLSFDAALRWEPRDQSVRLTQVRVQDLALNPGQAATRSSVERLGAALAERVLEDISLYRLSDERAAELQRRGLMPGAVTVTSRGVEITFVPSTR